MDDNIMLKEESYKVIGAAMEVHAIIGCGFTEPIYQEAFEHELALRGIPFNREQVINIIYKGITLKKSFRPDFICFDKIIVELKSVDELSNEHLSQVYNYLKATGLQLGLLINFGTKALQYKRIIPKDIWLQQKRELIQYNSCY